MNTLSADEWLKVLVADYQDYIRSGGALLRLAVPIGDDAGVALIDQLVRTAEASNMLHAVVDGSSARLHMPQDIVTSVAQQIDWIALVGDYLRAQLAAEGFAPPTRGLDSFLQRAAELNSVDRGSLLARLVTSMSESTQSLGLTRDFRVGINQLCSSVLSAEDTLDDHAINVIDWLRGGRRSLGEYRRSGIFHRVARTNARPVLRSALAWLSHACVGGTMIVIDARRLAFSTRGHNALGYPKSSMIDAYEVLREFIDDSHNFRGTMLIWVMDPEFLDLEPHGRGVGAYPALRYRVYDEVHDQRAVNPLATMVRVTERTKAATRDGI